MKRTFARNARLSMLFTLCWASAEAAIVNVFTDRSAFEMELGSSIVDDYTNPAYVPSPLTDADMSAVLGETEYTATQFLDRNSVVTDGSTKFYCSGCNGTFLLDFTSTSVGDSEGVFGVGLDIERNNPAFRRVAFATFGDGTVGNFSLPAGFFSSSFEFWGITSPDKIESIHFGLSDGRPTFAGAFVITNLTIGERSVEVPEPSGLVLFVTGMLGAVRSSRRSS